ncbi:anaphase-promoting complex subunit 13 [Caerostris extrusa]|uniref:Anaphase-promoting complex subunit 13 n=1 Tax=Caerostris extrusa TaxID=172846 RepID=A0AAV4Y5I7_CAEEX|nr:anaphase-promoting complex subunit 13 [Caerostris extrusa]
MLASKHSELTHSNLDNPYIMDSNVVRNRRLIDIVCSSWREEKLPDESIAVPASELPDPEPDNGNPQETLKEQEQKWTDLALNKINRTTPTASLS